MAYQSRFAAVLICVFFVGTALEADTPPNVILCMADDLGWGDVGYNGNKTIKTPALDAMAREGIRFNRWYAASAVCSPTRGSCLTGRHPIRYGVTGANSGHLLSEELTLAEALKQRGYTTGHFGKWHLGTLTTEIKDSNRGRPGKTEHFSPPWKHGFDICFSTEAKVPTFDPMKKPAKTDGRFWQPVKTGNSQPYGTYYWDHTGKRITDNLEGDDSRVIMDRAIPFIENAVKKDEPFFCVIWFHAPHLPCVAGPKHAGLYPDLDMRQQMYYGCISALDEQMGRLRTSLQNAGVADNTMLWFSSDNGPENRTPGSAGPLRKRKRSLHDGGVRVPGLLVWPERFKGPRQIETPCFVGDYLPTVMKTVHANSELPDVVDGENLMPILGGEKKNRDRPICFKYGRQSSIVDNRFKLYREKPNEQWMLFDMNADISEANDLIGSHPEIAQRLKKEFESWEKTLAN